MPSDNASEQNRFATGTGLEANSPVATSTPEGGDYAKANLLQIPSIATPKGGGALHSIDEKFQVNGVNGTAALNVPIPFSKTRTDFAPSLSLSYNSGGGNGPFGLGWDIGLPSIRRRTDKLLPRYRDATDSDIFQLAGVEDLVVQLVSNAQGPWQPDIVNVGSYSVKRYRPRIEGAFILIEQITSPLATWWKTTAKDNTVTFYGLSAAGRIAN